MTYLLAQGCPLFAVAQKGHPAKVPTTVSVSTFYPQHIDFSPSKVSSLKVPLGFSVSAVATGLGKPRMLALSDNGSLYVTRRDVWDLLMLSDMDGDGKFETMKSVWANFNGVHGIVISDGMIYLAFNKILKRGKLDPDGSITDTVVLATDLPQGSQHPNMVLNFGPDGMLYISVFGQEDR